MRFATNFLLIFIIFCFQSYGQKNLLQFLKSDTSYTVIKGVSRDNKIVKLPVELNCEEGKHHYIVKAGSLYVQVDGSGKIYKIDSLGNPIRLDKTCYEGYNFMSYNFTANNKFYSLGGWGFWQYNGALRYFDKINKEWEIYPLNKDVPFAQYFNASVFHDFVSNTLYLIYEPVLNNYVKIPDKTNYDTLSVECLNMNSLLYWDKPKRLNKNLFLKNILAPSSNVSVFSTDLGMLVETVNYFLLLDFKNEAVYQINNDLGASIIANIVKNPKGFIITRKGSINFYNPAKDSITTIPLSLKDFVKLDKKLFIDEPKQSNIHWSLILIIFLFTLLISVSVLIFYKQKNQIKSLVHELQKKNNGNGHKELTIDKSSMFIFNLTEIEKVVLELLLENTSANQFTSLDELNRVLGVKNKDVHVQNKLRSEVLHMINEKFMVYASIKDLLIERERTEFDKRVYQYRINEKYLNKLK